MWCVVRGEVGEGALYRGRGPSCVARDVISFGATLGFVGGEGVAAGVTRVSGELCRCLTGYFDVPLGVEVVLSSGRGLFTGLRERECCDTTVDAPSTPAASRVVIVSKISGACDAQTTTDSFNQVPRYLDTHRHPRVWSHTPALLPWLPSVQPHSFARSPLDLTQPLANHQAMPPRGEHC